MTILVRSNDAKADAQVNQPAVSEKPEAPSDQTVSAPVEATKPAEQKESEASEPSETEAESETESEGEESEPKEGEESEPKDEANDAAKGKKKGGFQRRIDKLNAKLAAERGRADMLENLLAKQGAGAGAKADAETKPAKPAAGDGKPNPDDFDTHAEYVEALTDWKTDQKLKEHDQRLEKDRLKTEQAKQVETYSSRAKAFSAKTPDFEDVMAEVADVQLSPAIQDILLSSENGPELAYEMAKDPDQFARLCKLPPAQAYREVGKFEASLAIKPSAAKKAETKQITQAPQPLKPVNAGGKGSVQKSIYEASAMTQAEYERARKEQMRRQA